jgi:uncharacterized membrane protein YjjP (DUF1212 family)
MDYNMIPHLAAKAGRIILENGGETYRVEETIIKICKAYGLKECDSFVMPTGIMLSVIYEDGKTASIVRRVKRRSVNLERVAMVNAISRELAFKVYPAEVLQEKLNLIEASNTHSLRTTLFFSSLGAGAFTLMFGGNYYDFIAAFIIGSIIKYISYNLSLLDINDFFINILGGAIGAALAILSSYIGLAYHLDIVIIGSIMLLAPGLAITNAIRDTLSGDLVAGISRGIEAFLIAVGVAVGTGIVYKLWFALTGGIYL